MATTVSHKRGDTFVYSAVIRESKSGPAIDLTGWTIASMIRDADSLLIADLDVSITTAASGAYAIRADITDEWPIGQAYWDIQYTDADGVIRSTETINLQIIEDVTYPEPEPVP